MIFYDTENVALYFSTLNCHVQSIRATDVLLRLLFLAGFKYSNTYESLANNLMHYYLEYHSSFIGELTVTKTCVCARGLACYPCCQDRSFYLKYFRLLIGTTIFYIFIILTGL